HVRDLDQLERRLVHVFLEVFVAIPVAVRFLHDDAAFEQQPLEHFRDVEVRVLRVAHAERDVLEIAEYGHVAGDLVGHRGRANCFKGAIVRRSARACRLQAFPLVRFCAMIATWTRTYSTRSASTCWPRSRRRRSSPPRIPDAPRSAQQSW